MAKPKVVEVKGPQSALEGSVAAVWTSIDSLTEWDRNPRINDPAVAGVARSIETYGFGAPIVAQAGTGFVIAGHTRIKAARSLEMKTVPVRYLEISDSKARALALADNKLGELAGWDNTMLSEALESLGTAGEDLATIGFSDEAMSRLLGTMSGPDSNEVDVDSFEFAHKCPKCGFGFNE